MTDLCVVFEVHQPLRLNRNFHQELYTRGASGADISHPYFDYKLNKHVFDRISHKCYFPANQTILEQVDKHKADRKRFKVSYSVSGVFIEQCERWNPDLLETFWQLANSRCVEFLDQTYYHSLAGLYDSDRGEFIEQVRMHRQLMKDLLNYEPKVFENTECLYNNAIAKTVEKMGYKAMITEGVERVLGWRSPNYVYKAKDSPLRVLTRNYRLSDDIGFRFSARWWERWPLTADKYSDWLAACNGQAITLFIDYETFGEHHWADTGIFEFLRWLPSEVAKWDHLEWHTPSEVIDRHQPVGELDVVDYSTISWADLERDTSAWIVNPMQLACYEQLKEMEPLVKATENEDMLKLWRYLQSSDHLYYMSVKGGGPGDVHCYFSHYGNPIEAFTVYMRAISDLEARVVAELKTPEHRARMTMRRLPTEKGFTFFNGFASPTKFQVRSIKELYNILREIHVGPVQFHMERGDIERWIREVIGEDRLADELTIISKSGLKGEQLRVKLSEVVGARVKELEKITRAG